MLEISDPISAIISLLTALFIFCVVLYVVVLVRRRHRKAAKSPANLRSLAIRAAWSRRWLSNENYKNTARKPIKGTIAFEDGRFTFTDTEGNALVSIPERDIKKVRGFFYAMGGVQGISTLGGIYEASLLIVPRRKQQDLLSFSWTPGEHGPENMQSIRTWLKAFRLAGIRTKNDTYYIVGLFLLLFSAVVVFVVLQ